MEKHDPDAIYPNTIKYTDKETVYCDTIILEFIIMYLKKGM